MGASCMVMPLLRLESVASTSTVGCILLMNVPSGSMTIGISPCSNAWITSSRVDTWQAVIPSTVMRPWVTASAKATVRRRTVGCASSLAMTRKPARVSRCITPVARSPAPFSATSGVSMSACMSVPAQVAQGLRYLLPGAGDCRDELGLFGTASLARPADGDRRRNHAQVVEDGRGDGLDTLFQFALRDGISALAHLPQFF